MQIRRVSGGRGADLVRLFFEDNCAADRSRPKAICQGRRLGYGYRVEISGIGELGHYFRGRHGRDSVLAILHPSGSSRQNLSGLGQVS
jgi:hypothetical protein